VGLTDSKLKKKKLTLCCIFSTGLGSDTDSCLKDVKYPKFCSIMTLIIHRVQNVSFMFAFSLMVVEYLHIKYHVSSFNNSVGYRHETGCTLRPYCGTQGVEEQAIERRQRMPG
jgi:hypothetical protein